MVCYTTHFFAALLITNYIRIALMFTTVCFIHNMVTGKVEASTTFFREGAVSVWSTESVDLSTGGGVGSRRPDPVRGDDLRTIRPGSSLNV